MPFAAALRVLLLLTGLVALAGCSPRETNAARGTREGVLHRGIGPELSDLDPHLATGTTDYSVLSAVLEGLVAEDPVDLHPVPGVAESWDVSPDGLTYTFHLRDDARWSNGQPVTAGDFVASWKRVLTRSLGADYATLLYVIQGAEAFHKGATEDFSTVGIEARDDRTLVVHLEYAAGNFLSILQHWVWWPVYLPAIEGSGSAYTRGNPWAKPETFVGNGPFILSERRPGQRTVVKKSPTYWDAAHVRLNGIVFYPIDDIDAEERAFRAGQLHLTETIPVAKIDSYRQRGSASLRIDPYLGTYFYRINVTRPFLNERKVRAALSLAVDRDLVVRNITRGGQQPAVTFTPPGTAGYRPPTGHGYDLTRARALLAEAGYPNGDGAPAIELLYNTSENHRVIAEALQGMWRTGLGLNVRLVNMENQSVLAARRTGSYELLRSVWIGDYEDPASFLSIWTGDSGNNYTGWRNADYDRILYRAIRTPDKSSRDELFRQAESLLLDDLPLIPIYHYTHVFLKNPDVQGWHSNLLDHHPYKAVSLGTSDPSGNDK